MRQEMREIAMKEEMKVRLSERNQYADRLFEKWSKTSQIGDGLIEMRDKDESKARALSIILENQENHLARLTETQISNSFGTTPQNLIRVIRLGYPNSVRGELFLEWAMETARDSIYYLSPVYTATKRGATVAGVTHQSSAYRYGMEVEEESIGTGDGTTKAFTGASGGSISNPPLRPYTVKVYVNNSPVATDDGSGNMIGTLLDTGSTNTINYDTGALTVTFTTAPASAATIVVAYNYDSEDSDQYTDLGSIELQLRDYQFRVKPMPLYVSWSKMTEILINTTLNIDAEDALVRGAADELKKSLDFYAVREAWRASNANTAVSFDTAGATGESEIDRAMSFSRTIDQASDVMFNAVQRGGVSKMVAGPGAASYIKLHRRFSGANAQPKVGIHRIGSIDGIDLYKAPSAIVPDAQVLFVHKNEQVPEDVSLALGTLIPLYRTQSLEFKEFYTETGMAYFGDSKVMNSSYLVRGTINNL